MINSNILKTWNEERIKYQIRYAKSCAEYHKDPENLDNKGHMHEQSWVLINVFGISAKQWRFCLVRAIIPVLSEPVFRLTLIHFDFA